MVLKQLFIISLMLTVVNCKVNEDSFFLNLRDNQYKYQIKLYPKALHNVKHNKTYYWYKNGKVMHTQGGFSGKLLNGKFEKFYINNQLCEKGSFKKGLKDGIWIKWYKNGSINIINHWKKGLKNGLYIFYNEEGKIISKGKYKKNMKHGQWIYPDKGDTVYFRKGAVINKDSMNFFYKIKKIFNKNED